jgi:hypothetical protein
MKKFWNWVYTLKGLFLLLFEILWTVRRADGAGCSVLILFTLGLHSNQEEELMWITNVMRILWLHKTLSTKDTCPMRHLLGFKFFHKPYQVLELMLCTEYLSLESQKLHFWKLEIRCHNCAGIKYTCLKYHLNIFEELHKKLSELQQLEDELKTMSKNGIGQVTCKRQ